MAEQSISKTIDQITKEIIHYEDTALNRAEDALRFKVLIGERLIQAKELLPHGQFQEWLEKSVKFEYSYAARHMKLARNVARVPHLPADASIRMALRAIEGPKEPKEPGESPAKPEPVRVVLVLSTGEEATLRLEDGPADVFADDLRHERMTQWVIRGAGGEVRA